MLKIPAIPLEGYIILLKHRAKGVKEYMIYMLLITGEVLSWILSMLIINTRVVDHVTTNFNVVDHTTSIYD